MLKGIILDPDTGKHWESSFKPLDAEVPDYIKLNPSLVSNLHPSKKSSSIKSKSMAASKKFPNVEFGVNPPQLPCQKCFKSATNPKIKF